MDAVVQHIRQKAMELAVAGQCKVFSGTETETGEFNIDFSTRGFHGKANIRISQWNGGYVSVVSLRLTGNEREYFWDRQFFDNDGRQLIHNNNPHKNHGGRV